MDNLESQNDDRPFVLGITGGIGSGKTTVCQIIASFGVPVFYADDSARRIMSADPEVISEVIQEFGDESYDDNGLLDRSYIASIVFDDEARLSRLNEIVHPRVRKSFADFIQDYKNERLVVHESAIIYESQMDDMFDAVVVVDAGVDERIERAIDAGKSEDDFRRRLSNQMPASELRELADYIIVNNGSLDDLEKEVELLLESLVLETGKRG